VRLEMPLTPPRQIIHYAATFRAPFRPIHRAPSGKHAKQRNSQHQGGGHALQERFVVAARNACFPVDLVLALYPRSRQST
jgi:hypothetical protein